ncbi:uncharacterized protein DUF4913 [Kribbella rubisoli]|uniref:Uncharacterized protein DUF4913 n=1 Tax=Kribbella rubisoli TaxID=3075929 RepID=A0A4Q7WR27_9ACTN|nr:DUF4913 domain-containing protein [Kribbella rubisoli]RZU12691.1 uncharacterized protein DUF4913 [Kribbella rubisoli]
MDGDGAQQSDHDAADLAALRKAMDGLRYGSRREGAPASGFRPRFADLESWVHEFFVLTFGRCAEQGRWCAQWWDHPEAVLRLDALWRSWEVASLDPIHGVADWIRNYLDPNLVQLCSDGGPFARCAEERHRPTPVLPVCPPPDGFGAPPRHWWEVLGERDR